MLTKILNPANRRVYFFCSFALLNLSMKRYRHYPLFLSLLSLSALFSCSHHDKTVIPPTPPIPAPVDSLFSWRLIDSLVPAGIEDIWFTSASKGFYLGG